MFPSWYPKESSSLPVTEHVLVVVKPWQSKSYSECQRDLKSFAQIRGVPLDVPWSKLSKRHRRWVLEGEGSWDDGLWYGVRRFFKWLETKSYKMHIRVLLSKYRTYRTCPDCHGARLKPESLLWRLGENVKGQETDSGLSVHELMLLPIDRCFLFFESLLFQ